MELSRIPCISLGVGQGRFRIVQELQKTKMKVIDTNCGNPMLIIDIIRNSLHTPRGGLASYKGLPHLLPHLFNQHIHAMDSLAEWSKALAPGASPQGRGFEPHSCHFGKQRFFFCVNAWVMFRRSACVTFPTRVPSISTNDKSADVFPGIRSASVAMVVTLSARWRGERRMKDRCGNTIWRPAGCRKIVYTSRFVRVILAQGPC